MYGGASKVKYNLDSLRAETSFNFTEAKQNLVFALQFFMLIVSINHNH